MRTQRKLRHSILLVLFGWSILALASGLPPDQPKYPSDVTRWEEVTVPPEGRNSDRAAWKFAAMYSQISWSVYLEHARPKAKLTNHTNDSVPDPPPFDAYADGFLGANRFRKVDDGWLVGFNHGEFGAELYWFDRDEKHHYMISGDHVVAFFSLPDGIYAIEGLAHMNRSCGSVIRIARPTKSAHWQVSRVVGLPSAPSAVAVRRDGSMLIVLSDSLVSVGPDHHVETLISNAPWRSLGPNSSTLTRDESHLYIGMHQFVGEVDLTANHLRLLVPSLNFLNKLPDDSERRIRQQYSADMEDSHQAGRPLDVVVGNCDE